MKAIIGLVQNPEKCFIIIINTIICLLTNNDVGINLNVFKELIEVTVLMPLSCRYCMAKCYNVKLHAIFVKLIANVHKFLY